MLLLVRARLLGFFHRGPGGCESLRAAQRLVRRTIHRDSLLHSFAHEAALGQELSSILGHALEVDLGLAITFLLVSPEVPEQIDVRLQLVDVLLPVDGVHRSVKAEASQPIDTLEVLSTSLHRQVLVRPYVRGSELLLAALIAQDAVFQFLLWKGVDLVLGPR